MSRRVASVVQSFGLKQIDASENIVKSAILEYLRVDRRVAWAHRFNSGMHVIEGDSTHRRRAIKYAFTGCADILGQLADGRFLAIEVKSSTGHATIEQQEFVDCVNAHGGVALVARSIDDVIARLDGAMQHAN